MSLSTTDNIDPQVSELTIVCTRRELRREISGDIRRDRGEGGHGEIHGEICAETSFWQDQDKLVRLGAPVHVSPMPERKCPRQPRR
jgi:hypothetical protein